jgi:membrane protein required for colicin V production
MQGADYLIVAVMTISVIVGMLRGFVREVVALITWVVAIWFAWRFSAFLHPYLGGILHTDAQKAWVARGLAFLGVMLLGALVGAILSHFTRRALGLSVVDRLLGFLFGVTRGAIIVGFAAMLGSRLELQDEPWWTQSKLAPYAVDIAHWIEKVAGEHRYSVGLGFEPAGVSPTVRRG